MFQARSDLRLTNSACYPKGARPPKTQLPTRICREGPTLADGTRRQNGISSSMSLLRAPAATGRRGALVGPPEPKSTPESSDPKLPPPPRPSSIVRLELKPCRTTSVEYFSTPLWSVHLRVCN